MTVIEPGPITGRAGLVERVKGILTQPKPEWERIDGEPATIQGLYVGYACILAAIPPIANLINGMVFGHGIPGLITYRPNPVMLIIGAIVTYVLALVGMGIIGFIIEALATSFGGTKNRVQAFKVAAYSMTAAWVGGIFYLIPWIGWLLVLVAGIYSIYLLYLGLPRVMHSPEDKAIGYTAVTVIVAIVVYWVIGIIAGAAMMMGVGTAALGMASAANHAVTPAVVSIGGQTVDTGRLQAAANQMQAAANGQTASGATIKAVAPDTLKGLLPGGLVGGYSRSEVSANGVAAGGFGGTSAEARYAKGDSAITLDVTDMAAVGALASLGSSMGVSSSRETSTGYEKVGTINGRLTTEEYDNQAHSGKYSVVVGQRFMVQASGQQVSMDDLKHAVAVVDSGKLESWAKA